MRKHRRLTMEARDHVFKAMMMLATKSELLSDRLIDLFGNRLASLTRYDVGIEFAERLDHLMKRATARRVGVDHLASVMLTINSMTAPGLEQLAEDVMDWMVDVTSDQAPIQRRYVEIEARLQELEAAQSREIVASA